MVLKLILGLVSSILLLLSYPGFNIEVLAFIALVPLFFAIENLSRKNSFLVGLSAGVIFYLGLLWWLTHVTIFGYIVLSIYLGLYWGVFSFLANIIITGDKARRSIKSLILFPAIWVVLEYIRCHLFSGFGWGLLGYSQFLTLPVVQIADVTGVWGVSFLVVLVNTAIWYGAHSVKLGVRSEILERFAARRIIVVSLACLLVLGAVLGYGYSRLKEEFHLGRSFKVSVIQGNIPQGEKWDRRLRKLIMDKYFALTRMASFDKPDIIIWPETSVPGTPGTDGELFHRIRDLSNEINLPILVGAPVEGNLVDSLYNSALLFIPGAEKVDRYDKLHLVPFGEFIPAESKLGFVRGMVDEEIGRFKPGKEYKLLSFQRPEKVSFAVLICFEDIFPELVRALAKEDCDFLVNMTNDAWFGKTSAPYQHAQASVFRAIENRKSVVRAANTGLSCFISPKGEILETVHDETGEEIFVTGYRTHEISLCRLPTIYSRFGDYFALISLLIMLLYTALKFINL